MTYSFTVRAGTRAQAKTEVAEKLAAVVENQPIYREVYSETKAAVFDLIDQLSEDFESGVRDVTVSVSAEMQGKPGAVEAAKLFISIG